MMKVPGNIALMFAISGARLLRMRTLRGWMGCRYRWILHVKAVGEFEDHKSVPTHAVSSWLHPRSAFGSALWGVASKRGISDHQVQGLPGGCKQRAQSAHFYPGAMGLFGGEPSVYGGFKSLK